MARQLTISDISFLDLSRLEPHGPDTYVGVTVQYPWSVGLPYSKPAGAPSGFLGLKSGTEVPTVPSRGD